jgi:hypothetical protein
MSEENINFTRRHVWFKKRVEECMLAISAHKNVDWTQYRVLTKELAEDLLYAVTEWDKYYETV